MMEYLKKKKKTRSYKTAVRSYIYCTDNGPKPKSTEQMHLVVSVNDDVFVLWCYFDMETRPVHFLFRVTVDIKSAGRINIYYDCPASTINMNLITAAVYSVQPPPQKNTHGLTLVIFNKFGHQNNNEKFKYTFQTLYITRPPHQIDKSLNFSNNFLFPIRTKNGVHRV